MDAIDIFLGAGGFSSGDVMAGCNACLGSDRAAPPAARLWPAVRALSTAQSLRFNPRTLSFFAYQSLRFAAFAAVSMAA